MLAVVRRRLLSYDLCAITQIGLLKQAALPLRFTAMPPKKSASGKQATISTFFNSSSSKKRGATNDDEQPRKVQKKDDSNTDGSTASVSPPMSPEQKARMDANRQAALEKLKSKLAPTTMGNSWKSALSAEFEKPYFSNLQEFVAAERSKFTVYPPEDQVFSWTQFFDIQDTKVVIIGQDPYHGPKQAHGLCFSVQVGVAVPPSLQNMYKELANDIPGFTAPKHGYLVGWAQQGVLLLNACLTVVASKANSHQGKGWEKLTDATIKWINSNLNGVVFILWGGFAQKKGNFIDSSRHKVLKGPHPSPLSAHRGFFGCKHFSKTNEYLLEKKKKPIDWCHLPSVVE